MRQKIYIGTSAEINFYFWGNKSSVLSPLSQYARYLPRILSLFSKQTLSCLEGFEINMIDCKKIFAKCRPARKQIFISSLMLEFLWLSIYVNHKLSDAASFGDNIERRREILLSTDVLLAMRRCKELSQGKVATWPNIYIPLPELHYDIRNYKHSDVASEISLYGLGFIILHELAHYFMFSCGEIEQGMHHENMADESALSQYLDKESIEPSSFLTAFKKRVLSIVEVCSMFVFIDQISLRNHSTHPSGIFRLQRLLESCKDTYAEYESKGLVTDDIDSVFGTIYLHASFNLYFYSQNIFGEHCDEIKIMRNELLEQSYDSPNELFLRLIDLYRAADRNRVRVVILRD